MAKKSLQDISPDRIYADTGRNFRHEWKYRVEPKPNFNPETDSLGFYEDIVINGVLVNIEIAKLPDDRKDAIEKLTGTRYDFIVLRGHRRFKAVCLARQSDPGLFKKLTCVVHEGMSASEELAYMFDDKGVEHLDEYERHNAIVRLYASGKGQREIERITGLERNFVQDMVHIADLPDVVRVEYEKRFTPVGGKPAVKWTHFVPITRSSFADLHKAWNTDRDAKIAADSPEGAFCKLWTEISTKKVGGDGTPPKKSLTKKEMDERQGFIAGCEALEEAHRFYSNEGGNIQAAAEQYRSLERQAGTVPALESKIVSLEEQVANLLQLVDEKDAELAALQAANLVPTNGKHQVGSDLMNVKS